MESELFCWTGKAIWYLVCGSTVACILAVAVAAPIMVYRATRQNLWKWKLSGELAKTGFTEADVRWVMKIPGGLPCDYDKFIEAVRRVKERGDARIALSKAEEEVK